MGGLSIVWYVGLTLVSEDILFDSIAALGLMIAFYYGMTGFACVWYFRRDLTKSARNFWLVGVAPLVGGLDARGDLRQVVLRPEQGGRRLDDVLRARLAARHRDRVPAARPGADAASGARWATASSGSAGREVADPRVLDDDKVAPEPAPV